MPDNMSLMTLDDLPVDGKRVIVRVDLNVSVGEDGVVDGHEDYRIEAALPTIEELQQRRCKILLLTHRGRPQKNHEDIDLSPVHRRLEQLLKDEVKQAKALFGDGVDAVVDGMEPGGVVLLPNVRTDQREEASNHAFAESVASSADAYVNEAFSNSHRSHTSMTLLPQLLPACAGRRTVDEVEALTKLRQEPTRPYVAIISGAKIRTKIGLIHDLLHKVDALCVGGRIANVFLAAKKHYIAPHIPEEEVEAAHSLLNEGRGKIVLPVDVVAGTAEGSNVQTLSLEELDGVEDRVYDVGPKTIERFLSECAGAKTIMWNGPMGMFEVPPYNRATHDLAHGLAQLEGYRVVGGGQTVEAIERQRVRNKYNHVSVGGGAMIAFLEGKRLPGLVPLRKK